MMGNTSNRRAFLKKTATTAVLGGGLLASAEPVAASTQTIKIKGTGSYDIFVNDPNATKQDDVEDDDMIDSDPNKSILDGSVSGDADTYDFEGQVTRLFLDGDITVVVSDPNGMNRGGRLDVQGGDGAYYLVQSSESMEEQYDNLESKDAVDSDGQHCDGHLDGLDDTDSYYLDGTIQAVMVETDSGGYDSVRIDHNL
ncbi:twin-arginine translocation signal domain-containing protein [Halorussus pelagicus]|uniref:twin-arginine translocation signal domain-containing protein n=1 Tax=Halorussus pelagicus TaxID=2505977 RepID=UPI000FFC4B4E|nr:twin-arginine translocation signal domain-containing protein [Halorussus pelagicus]